MKLVKEHINESLPFVKSNPVYNYLSENYPKTRNYIIKSIDIIDKACNKNKDLTEKFEIYPIKEYIDALNIIIKHKEMHDKSIDDILYPYFQKFSSGNINKIIGSGIISYCIINNYFNNFLNTFLPDKHTDFNNSFFNIYFYDVGVAFNIPRENIDLFEIATNESINVDKFFNNEVSKIQIGNATSNYDRLIIYSKIMK